MLSRVREINQQVDQWFQERPVLRGLVFVVTHAMVYAMLAVALGGESVRWWTVLGIVGGAVAAILDALFRL